MGSDDLHKQNNSKKQLKRARKKTRHQRNPPKKEAYDRVLIVCEGEKTEPFYIRALCRNLKLSSTRVEVKGDECGSSPTSVINYAIEYYRKDPSFEKIFCVIDKDTHSDYDRAINDARQAKLKRNNEKKIPGLKVITSIPCFEYWILLHFKYTDKPFHSSENKSICDQVGEELKEHMSFYGKGRDLATNIRNNQQQAVNEFPELEHINSRCTNPKKEQNCYDYIFDKIFEPCRAGAKKRAKSIWQQHVSVDRNPSTEMHELVEYLENIKKKEISD